MVANTPWSMKTHIHLESPSVSSSGLQGASLTLRGVPRKGWGFFFATLVLLVLSLNVSSCELFALDMFPQYLSYEIASLDLKGELQNKGVPGNFNIDKIDILTTPLTDKRYVMIYLTFTVGSSYLVILDGVNLNIQTVIQDSFNAIGPMMMVDMNGCLVSAGNMSPYVCCIDPLNFSYTDIFTALNSGNQSGFTDRTTGTSYVIQYSEPTMQGYSYLGTWSTNTPLTLTVLNTTPYPGLTLQSFYTDGTILRFLLTSYSGSSFAVTYPTIPSFVSAFGGAYSILENPSAHYVFLPSTDNDSGWMTRGGAVLLRHDNQNRLVRYNPDTGSEVDSFTVSDKGDPRYGFSSDGQRWALYEGETGKLHLLRTWW